MSLLANSAEIQRDKVLFVKLKNGDQKAWSEVYRSRSEKVVGHLMKRFGIDKDRATYYFKEAVLVLFDKTKSPQFDLQVQIASMLCKFAGDKYIDYLRATSTHVSSLESVMAVGVDDDDLDEEMSNLQWSVSSVWNSRFDFDTDYRDEQIQSALNELRLVDCHDIFVYRYWNGLSYQEIAEVVNRSNPTQLRNKFKVCKDELRRILISKGVTSY